MLISERIKAQSESKQLRVTTHRVFVANMLQQLNCYSTAEDIWLKLRAMKYSVSLATVYLSLNWLVEKGFVEKQAGPGREMVYTICE